MVGPDGRVNLGDHGICHGDLGKVELLTAAPGCGLPGGAAENASPVSPGQVVAAVVADARARGWRCGLPAGSQPVGLMAGITGIGYQLLHLARPDRVPSILRLRPPVTAASPSGPAPEPVA
jgi:lantibiotic modifying enzyme